MIKLSLFAQHRAERDSHTDNVEQKKYVNSQDYVSDWFCTAAVSAVEKADSFDLETSPEDVFEVPIDDSFFKGIDYSGMINDHDDLEQFVESNIRNSHLPLVLDIASKNYKGVHAAIVLGYNKSGDVIVWEKVRKNEPYKISLLKDILNRHPHCYWGVRSFRESGT